MIKIIGGVISGVATSAINAYFNYKTRRAASEIEIIKLDSARRQNIEKWEARSEILRHGSFWFQLIFIIPLGLWWAGVMLYSLLWCKACAYPMAGLDYYWEIAALPSPISEWAGAIVAFLFLTETFKR